MFWIDVRYFGGRKSPMDEEVTMWVWGKEGNEGDGFSRCSRSRSGSGSRSRGGPKPKRRRHHPHSPKPTMPAGAASAGSPSSGQPSTRLHRRVEHRDHRLHLQQDATGSAAVVRGNEVEAEHPFRWVHLLFHPKGLRPYPKPHGR